MKPAIIVVDMLKDTFSEESNYPIKQEGRAILANLQRLLKESRKRGFPVIFACDSFLKEDFIFTGKMKPHSLRGTKGSEVMDELKLEPNDIFLPKRRFSAFFKTDLDQTLRVFGVDTIVVTGVTAEFCVLTTAVDGVCLDFYAIILEDCTASHKKEVHDKCLSLYTKTALYPLLRVMTLDQFLQETSA